MPDLEEGDSQIVLFDLFLYKQEKMNVGLSHRVRGFYEVRHQKNLFTCFFIL